jgi:2-dehydro-3-deoxygluconokinase
VWAALGGQAAAAKVNGALVDHVDVLIGNEEDFYAALGYEAAEGDEDFLELDVDRYKELLGRVMADRPTLSIAASTLREVHTASVNDWSAVCHTRDGFHVGPSLDRLDIFDRVGGGDSFASGLIYGLLSGEGIDRALALGVAHGALAMTTPGDTSMARLDEVERVVAGGSARVVR